MAKIPNNSPLLSTTFDSQLGPIYAGAMADRVVFLYFAEAETKRPLTEVIEARFGQAPSDGESPVFEALRGQITRYLMGSLNSFTVPITPIGTAFELCVWAQLLHIPYGQRVTYKAIAEGLGAPQKTRAVGQAIGRNPLSILIPCHRVIGANKKLTGYSGGLTRKAYMLNMESALNE